MKQGKLQIYLDKFQIRLDLDLIQVYNGINPKTERKDNMSKRLTLKQWRSLRGLSQERLAELANIDSQTISDYETKEGRIESAQYSTLYRIAKVLEIEVQDIFLDHTWIIST